MSSEMIVLINQRMLSISKGLREKGAMLTKQAEEELNPLTKGSFLDRAVTYYEIATLMAESCEE